MSDDALIIMEEGFGVSYSIIRRRKPEEYNNYGGFYILY